jgi:hypothetical protein
MESLARQALGHHSAGFDLDKPDDRLLAAAGRVGEDRQFAAVRQRISRQLQRFVGAQEVEIDDPPAGPGWGVRQFDDLKILAFGNEPAYILAAREDRNKRLVGGSHRP